MEVGRHDSKPDDQNSDGVVSLQFSVCDTGIGIPADKQASVLDPFTQADASTTRRFGGTGLGLAISKELVDLMGGILKLTSQPGQGTQFFFCIPLQPAENQVVDQQAELESLEQMPVLLVDDNDTNRQILTEIFTAWRLLPVVASDGSQALQRLREAAETGNPFRLAILDCMMPEMDGFELARQIRREYPERDIKLIILSSATTGDEFQRCRESDIARYISKPVVQSELLDTVLHVMQVRQDVASAGVESQHSCPPMRVLVAEDGIANQHVAVGMLQAAGHQAVVVGDGREAVARWQSESFDLILMDMHMPVMDGIEATKEIRSHELVLGTHIPIIALTAAAMKEDSIACENAGMDGYLTKPIHQRQLQDAISVHAPEVSVLEQIHSAQDSPTMSSPEPNSDDVRRPESIDLVVNESVDLEAAAGRVPGGRPGVLRLAEVFLIECAELLETLDQEIPEGDAAMIQRAAHTLKGSAGLFFADRLQELAKELEWHAKDHDLSACATIMDQLLKEADSVMTSLGNALARSGN